MRITFNSLRDGLNAINTAANQLAAAQLQVASGKRVNVPSDDPRAAQRAINSQASIDELDAYKSVADSAGSRLSAIDSAMSDVVDKISEARVALQSALGTEANQAIRDSAASTFEGVRDAILADMNSTFGGTHLFSGTNAANDAYENVAGVWTYQGSPDEMSVAIGPNREVAVTRDGEEILKGTDSVDLLTVLDSLATAARTGDRTTLQAGIDQLDRAFTRATHAQSQVGYDETSIEDSKSRLLTLRTSAMAQLSKDQDANMAEAITRMSRAQTTYQAALGAVAATSKVSLMDYLK